MKSCLLCVGLVIGISVLSGVAQAANLWDRNAPATCSSSEASAELAGIPAMVLPGPGCFGSCEVTCDGVESYYNTRSYQCCPLAYACGGTAEWWPGYACWDQDPLIC
jgi:hypothetical protein